MTEVIVGRWGKSLAVRLPGEVVSQAGLKEGELVDVQARDGDIVIRQVVPRFTLTELFKGKSPQEWREAYADAFDWGPDVGGETGEE